MVLVFIVVFTFAVLAPGRFVHLTGVLLCGFPNRFEVFIFGLARHKPDDPTAYSLYSGERRRRIGFGRAGIRSAEGASRGLGSAMSSLVTLVKFFIDAAAQARTSARRVTDEPAATRLVLRRPAARRAWRCARGSFAPGSSTALSALSRHAGSSAGLVGSRAALTRTLKSAAGAAGSTFGSRCGELRLAERVLCTSAGTAATSQPRRRVLSHLALVDVQLRS